jgi:hypothetical protein
LNYSGFGEGYPGGLRAAKAYGMVVICLKNFTAIICDCISMKIFELCSEMIAVSAVQLEELPGLCVKNAV